MNTRAAWGSIPSVHLPDFREGFRFRATHFERGVQSAPVDDTWITVLGDDPPELGRTSLTETEFAVVFQPQCVHVRD